MTKHMRLPGPSNDTGTRYFVECQYKTGAAFSETLHVYTEAQCVEEIIRGQFKDILRIMAANDADGSWRDTSEDVARLIAQINPERCSDEAINLCSKFGCLTWEMDSHA